MDILDHPERSNTARHLPRAVLVDGSVHCSSDGEHGSWIAVGKFTAGHGWDVDVTKNGTLIAMRNAAYGERGDGLEVVAETLHAVIDGRAIGNTMFI